MKKNKNFIPILIYTNVLAQKKEIYQNNKGKAGVYRWVNKINGSSYIGSSANLIKRFYTYFNWSGLIKNNCYIISRALLKYGYENFNLEILEYCEPTREILIEREQYYLNNFNNDYNIAKFASSSLGIKRSEEFKRKISLSQKGKIISLDHRKAISEAMKGKPKSLEHKKALSKALKGKPKSLEHRKAISKALKGKFIGKSISFR